MARTPRATPDTRLPHVAQDLPQVAKVEAEAETPFWRKKLEDLTPSQWEQLCDGCGRCCLVKLEDEDTGKIHFTNVACTLFDATTCQCANYAQRSEKVSDCVTLTPEAVRSIKWLPPTCAYRLVAEERDLYWWHPLVSGSPDTVRAAGISVHGRVAASEDDVPFEQYPEFIVPWPGRIPKRAR